MIKKIIVGLLIFSILLSSTMYSFARNEEKQKNYPVIEETPGIQWSNQYGASDWTDNIEMVRQTSDGGYIIVGDTQSYSPNHQINAWLVKTDAAGNEVWNKTYGHLGSFGESVQQTSDGGYIFCGAVSSGMWLVKTDVQGEQQWEKSYGGVRGDCVRQVADGGYILTGYIGFGACLIRTDAVGNMLWKKIYFPSNYSSGFSLQQTSDGGFILTGDTTYYSDDPSYGKGYLLKTDQYGNEQWNWTYMMSAEVSRFFSVQQTPDNGYIVAGTITGVPWLVRTDGNGNEIWNKTLTDSYSIAIEVDQTNDGGYIFVVNDGNVYSCIIKTDANGTKEWELPIGSTTGLTGTYLSSVQQTADGGYITAGSYLDNPGCNALLIKIGHVPKVAITKPTNGVYLFDRKILNFFTPLVIGPITVEVNASDTKYSIDRVEFSIDGNLQFTDTTAPYSWRWTTRSLFRHTITATAYNAVGNCSSITINVRKLF